MILDASRLAKKSPFREAADVCVIGSGAGGALVAKELAERGHSVVVLEEGGYYTREQFTGNEMEMFRRLWRNAGLLPTRDRRINVLAGSCIGGTTVINMAICFRTPDRVLERWKREFGVDGVEPETMTPYFERVEREIGCLEVRPDLINRNNAVLIDGGKKLGIHAAPNRRNAPACSGCGTCAFGCPNDAKLSALVTSIPKADKAGARIYSRARADEVLFQGRRASHVRASVMAPPTGGGTANARVVGTLLVEARAIVVAAGSLYSPVLLLRSKLPRPLGHTGRHLRLHPIVLVYGRMPRPIYAYRGIPQAVHSRENADFYGEGKGGFMLYSHSSGFIGTAISLPGFGREHKERMGELARVVEMEVMVDDEGEGRIYPGPGLAPSIDYRLAGQDVESFLKGIRTAGRVYFEEGAREVWVGDAVLHNRGDLERLDASVLRGSTINMFSAHPQASCRMGPEPSRAVVDGSHRVHGTENLYVCDASVFPTSVGINPQVSVMALAMRAAEGIHAAL